MLMIMFYILPRGQVIEAVSGMSWEEFITKRILEKIGMKETKSEAG